VQYSSAADRYSHRPERPRNPQILLAMNGTYILYYMDTAELAKDKAYEFMFVLSQPRFRGGVQSIINPIAIR
jgi:hypothetical protein